MASSEASGKRLCMSEGGAWGKCIMNERALRLLMYHRSSSAGEPTSLTMS